MGNPKGSEAGFTLFEETVFGQAPAVPDGVTLHLVTFGLTESQELIEDETIGAGRGVNESMLGDISDDGDLTGNLNAMGHCFLIKHLLGAVSTTGTGPYTHEFTIGNLPVGALLELDNGPNLAGASRYTQNLGRRFTAGSFEFADKGPCKFTINTVGKKVAKSATPLDATPTDYGHTALSMFSAALEVDGSAFAHAKTISMNIDNEVSADESRVVGGNGTIQAADEGRGKVTGSMTGIYNAASQALIDLAFADQSSSLKITLSKGDGLGSAGNESIEFLIPNLKFGPVVPGVEGPAGRSFSVDFSAFAQGSDLGIKVTVKNSIETI